MPCELINDGYTLSDPCYGLDVVFRPMPYRDYDAYISSIVKAPAEKQQAMVADLIASRVVTWSATSGGVEQPVNGENFLKLPAPAGQRLRSLVIGEVAPEGDATPGDASKN